MLVKNKIVPIHWSNSAISCSLLQYHVASSADFSRSPETATHRRITHTCQKKILELHTEIFCLHPSLLSQAPQVHKVLLKELQNVIKSSLPAESWSWCSAVCQPPHFVMGKQKHSEEVTRVYCFHSSDFSLPNGR